MDIQKLIADLVGKLQGNEDLIQKFTADPVKTVESLLGVDLPDDQINAVVTAVKAKLQGGEVLEEAKGLLDKVKGILGK